MDFVCHLLPLLIFPIFHYWSSSAVCFAASFLEGCGAVITRSAAKLINDLWTSLNK